MSFLESLKNRNIAVIGAGITGQAMLSFLESKGAQVKLIDEKKINESVITEINSDLFSQFSLACVSPGWRTDHPVISEFRKLGTEILSEIDLAWRVKLEILPNQKWVALTGTNGKTTTIQMVASIFEAAGLSGTACGNVGETVIAAVTSVNKYDVLALELSSFQIEWSNEAKFEIGCILNIADDHIDWHGSFKSYAKSKAKLLGMSQSALLNLSDPEVMQYSTSYLGKKFYFSLKTPMPGELGLVENLLIDRAFTNSDAAEAIGELQDISPAVPHNVLNALAAGGIARALGISPEKVQQGLKNFVLDHHRLELILDKAGIKWVNDSKATNPHAALAAILSQSSVIWIAGGLAKGSDMNDLITRGKNRLREVILIGQDSEIIKAALTKHAPEVPVHIITSDQTGEALMLEVVTLAKSIAKSGDTVLLAPACASMDQFTSYADRGNSFTKAIEKLVAKNG